MRFGVVVFPGSNCDEDCWYALKEIMGQEVDYIWHKERKLREYDCIILPGGFSYGDYLRTGAIARFSPVIEAIKEFAERGGLILGICNGFQILLEAGLLPGAMLKNSSLRFRCREVWLRVEEEGTPFTCALERGRVLRIPIAHQEGNYYIDPQGLEKLRRGKRIIFRYSNQEGEITPEANPNGSVDNIGGILNERGNILGMMPHPERACESLLGSEDGKLIFSSLIKWVEEKR